MLSIIADAIARLDRLRNDRSLWETCAYRQATNESRGSHDANELERYRFLVAFQYNYTETDEDLIRFLFDQEVLAHQNDDFQGCGETLRLASFLLSRFRRGDDLWRFADAKLANFDTACGYDSQFLFSSGREVAIATLSAGEESQQQEVREYLFNENGDCWYSQAELIEWEQSLLAEFPNSIAEEDIRVWIDRAIDFQCQEEGLALLDEWEKSDPDEPLSSLRYLRQSLGDTPGAIKHQRQILGKASSAWDRVSAARALADLYVQHEQFGEAWRIIKQQDPDLQQIEDWNQVGLGRMLVKTAFDIAKASRHPDSLSAFEWACNRGDDLETTTLEILTTAIQAAERVGDERRAKAFRREAQAEQNRINQMLDP